jgi:hypothetical protein
MLISNNLLLVLWLRFKVKENCKQARRITVITEEEQAGIIIDDVKTAVKMEYSSSRVLAGVSPGQLLVAYLGGPETHN